MRSRLDLVIIRIIALAFPVQAMANALMTHCGQSHLRVHVDHIVAGPQAPVADVHGADHAGAAHHHDTADQAAATQHDTPALNQFTDLGNAKCSACASCCSGLTLVSALPQIPQPALASTVFVAVVPAVEAFAVDRPDRPPRRLCA